MIDIRPGLLDGFSPYDHLITVLCCEGLSSKEIADRLGKSTKAVDTYISRLMKSAGVKNRAALVSLYLRATAVRNLQEFLPADGRVTLSA